VRDDQFDSAEALVSPTNVYLDAIFLDTKSELMRSLLPMMHTRAHPKKITFLIPLPTFTKQF